MMLRSLMALFRPGPALCLLILAGPSFALAATTPLPQQDPSELKRLANDQRKLAEQARRLESLLETLETREREAGNAERADLLAGARKRMGGDLTPTDIVSLLETVASDLGKLRPGAALEAQAEVIRQLESLLDFLLQQKRQEELEKLLKDAAERRKALEALAKEQAALLNQTGELDAMESSSNAADPGKRKEIAEGQRKLNEEIEKFRDAEEAKNEDTDRAEKAAKAGAEAAELLDPQGGESPENPSAAGETPPGESPEGDPKEGDPKAGDPKEGDPQAGDPQHGEPSESPQTPPGEPAGQPPSGNQPPGEPPPGDRPPQPPSQSNPQTGQPPEPTERLDEAQEAQERALDQLRKAAEDARQEEQDLADLQRREELLNLLSEATRLRERHVAVQKVYAEFVEQSAEGRPSRSKRVQLRQWAEEEASIAEATEILLLEVQDRGADSVPYLMTTLAEDHLRLAEEMGPPNYLAAEDQVALADRIKMLWDDLILALQTEAERERPRMESPSNGDSPQPEEEQKQPLVSLASEVQLLKMMEQHLRDRMQRLHLRRSLMAEAGIEFDEDDLKEMDRIAERQGRLRAIFESIIKRAQESMGQETEEEGT